jgi:hypothetical protein
VRFSLRLALGELAAASVAEQQKHAALVTNESAKARQIARLEQWLYDNEHETFLSADPLDVAIICVLDSQTSLVDELVHKSDAWQQKHAALTLEIERLQDAVCAEVNDCRAEIRNLQLQLMQLDADNAALLARYAGRHALEGVSQ